MKNVFLDTNIILDIMAQRQPYHVEANAVMKLGIERKIRLCATSLTFANCAYILKHSYKHADPISVIKAYKQYIRVVAMDEKQCDKALHSGMPDFEDMLQCESAIDAKCDCIVTRNKKHFPQESIPILTAEEFITKTEYFVG